MDSFEIGLAETKFKFCIHLFFFYLFIWHLYILIFYFKIKRSTGVLGLGSLGWGYDVLIGPLSTIFQLYFGG